MSFDLNGFIIKLLCPDKYTLSLINHTEPRFKKKLIDPITKEEIRSIINQLAWDHTSFIDKKIEESTE